MQREAFQDNFEQRHLAGMSALGELYNGSSTKPLIMNAGDTVRIHFFLGAPGQGWNINVLDVTTGESGTIVLNDTPNSFV
jgi:hypothetical protein